MGESYARISVDVKGVAGRKQRGIHLATGLGSGGITSPVSGVKPPLGIIFFDADSEGP